MNEFSVQLREAAEPHAVAHDLGCIFLGGVVDTYLWFRCGPDKERSNVVSSAMTLANHGAVLSYRQLTIPHRQYFSDRYFGWP
mgnify:CR=1 FL=1